MAVCLGLVILLMSIPEITIVKIPSCNEICAHALSLTTSYGFND